MHAGRWTYSHCRMTGEVSSVEFLELELSRRWYYGVRHPRGTIQPATATSSTIASARQTPSNRTPKPSDDEYKPKEFNCTSTQPCSILLPFPVPSDGGYYQGYATLVKTYVTDFEYSVLKVQNFKRMISFKHLCKNVKILNKIDVKFHIFSSSVLQALISCTPFPSKQQLLQLSPRLLLHPHNRLHKQKLT